MWSHIPAFSPQCGSTNVSEAGKICNIPDIRWISRGMGSDFNTVVRWIFEPMKSLPNTDYSVILWSTVGISSAFCFSGYVLLLQISKYVTAHDEYTRSLSHAHISITSDKCWVEVGARVQSWAEQTNFWIPRHIFLLPAASFPGKAGHNCSSLLHITAVCDSNTYHFVQENIAIFSQLDVTSTRHKPAESIRVPYPHPYTSLKTSYFSSNLHFHGAFGTQVSS